MKTRLGVHWPSIAISTVLLACGVAAAPAAQESFTALIGRLSEEKHRFAQRQQEMLAQRYDLTDRPAAGVTMSRGKPVQAGVRAAAPGDHLGTDRRDATGGDQKQGSLGGRFLSPAASASRSRRDDLPADAD